MNSNLTKIWKILRKGNEYKRSILLKKAISQIRDKNRVPIRTKMKKKSSENWRGDIVNTGKVDLICVAQLIYHDTMPFCGSG